MREVSKVLISGSCFAFKKTKTYFTVQKSKRLLLYGNFLQYNSENEDRIKAKSTISESTNSIEHYLILMNQVFFMSLK